MGQCLSPQFVDSDEIAVKNRPPCKRAENLNLRIAFRHPRELRRVGVADS